MWAVVDYQLSDGDGLDFIRGVRTAHDDLKMKVVAVTGWSSIEGRLEQFISLSDHYLRKPFEWETLLKLTQPG